MGFGQYAATRDANQGVNFVKGSPNPLMTDNSALSDLNFKVKRGAIDISCNAAFSVDREAHMGTDESACRSARL